MPAPVVSRPTTPDAPAVSVTPMPRPSGLMRLTALKFPLLARAADTMPMGMTLCDASRPDYPIVYCNPGFERLAGFTADEVLGRNCRFLEGADTDPNEVARLHQALRDRTACSLVLLNYRKGGAPFWNALAVTPLEDETGAVTHFVVVQTDITPVKELETQFLQAQKMGVVGRLTGGVVHDFNNLLTVINGFAESALDALPDGHPTRAMLQQIVGAGERAAGLTRQLLAFSRKAAPVRAHADLGAVANASSGILRRLLGTGVELRTEFAPAVPPAAVAPGYAEQVLMNLVVNARDAMPHGGTVTVATAAARVMPDDPEHPGVAPGAYAVLRVTDTGCGMDEATQARMFEPFFTTKPPGAGTGLGLSTLRDIVHQARGHVRVHSARGRGTSFWVYLPVAAEACPAAPAAGPGPAGRGTETVLVIDADPAVRALMTHALRAHGYTVLSARDVCEGEARVRDHTGGLDAVVCDVPLAPAADQLTVRLRTRWPNLAVLFVSAAPGAEQFTSTAPEVPFLAKPFTPAALARSVRVLLDRR